MVRRNVEIPFYQEEIEARIGQMQQPKPMSGRIVVGGGKTWLVNPATGEKVDLRIAPPKGKVGDRDIADIINDVAKITRTNN